MTLPHLPPSICRVFLIAFLCWCDLPAEDGKSWEITEISGEKYAAVEQVRSFYRFEKSTRDKSTIRLESKNVSMELRVGSPECLLNGVKVILSKPVTERGDAVYISRADLAGLLEPMLRPNHIKGVGVFKTVIVDAAHGGKDQGFTNDSGTAAEFTLKIAKLAKTQLEARGFDVVLTRSADRDVSPEERLSLANAVEGSAVFVSISFNTDPVATNGIQTLPVARGEDIVATDPFGLASVALSTAIHGSLIRRLGEHSKDGGITRGEPGGFPRITHPAVLVKAGNITHPTDSRLIANEAYQSAVATGLVDGLLKYRFVVKNNPRRAIEDAPEP